MTLSINDVCEQRVDQRDVSSTVSHSKVMDSEDFDSKVEIDEVLSTLWSKKSSLFYNCNNSMYSQPILIIFLQYTVYKICNKSEPTYHHLFYYITCKKWITSFSYLLLYTVSKYALLVSQYLCQFSSKYSNF